MSKKKAFFILKLEMSEGGCVAVEIVKGPSEELYFANGNEPLRMLASSLEAIMHKLQHMTLMNDVPN